jgi:acetylornithine deacetylase/succinyl-diaminopimelate desuccinylase-like protein
MKGAVVMMICAMIRMKEENIEPAGDIVLAILADEEVEGAFGGKYVVDNYPELFKNVQYAIGEIGGFTMHLSGKKFYPIMIAEKQRCSLKTIIKGPGGHGSMPMYDGAMAKLGYVLSVLNRKKLPVHITEPSKMMIKALAENMPFPAGTMLSKLLDKKLTNKVLKIMGSSGRLFDPILHNTVNATIVRGGDRINVIPSEIELEFDGRLLPGFKKDDMIQELKQLLSSEYEFEVTYYCEGPQKVNMGLFNHLSDIIKDGDREAVPMPFVISGVTDARFFAKLGIQTYGFTPMVLPEDIDFSKIIHSENERIPVKALEFGVESIYKLLKTF